jgi:hypothetical protein
MEGRLKRMLTKFMKDNGNAVGPMSAIIICISALAVGFMMFIYYKANVKGPLVIKDGSA